MSEMSFPLYATLVISGISATVIFLYITHPSARFTAGERHFLSTSHELAGSRDCSQAPGTNATLARWRTAARRWASTVSTPLEVPASVYGLQQCCVCRKDVHRDGEMCHAQRSADCSACGQRVLLDYYGCPAAARRSEVHSTHRLSNLAPTTAAEWARSRCAVLKPTPFIRGKPTSA